MINAESRDSGEFLSTKSGVSTRSARSLRRYLMWAVGVSATIILGLVAAAGMVVLKKTIANDSDERILNTAALSGQLVERLLTERKRQVEVMAIAPSVIRAAQRGGEVSRERGLPKKSIDALEAQFKATRSQQVDSVALLYLMDLLPKLDIAEIMLTDEYGYNAVTTSPSSDFVQSDEAWWQMAWSDGSTTPHATNDPATKQVVVELAQVVRGGRSRTGVVKVKFGLTSVDSVLAQSKVAGTGLRVDLIDSTGAVIASSAPAARFKPIAGGASVTTQGPDRTFTYLADSVPQRAAVAPTNAGRWRVVAHMPESDANHAYAVARTTLLGGVAVMVALVILALSLAGRFIERRVTVPAEELAVAAEAVAAGDLSKQVRVPRGAGAEDEIGRLARAITAMIAELRRLAAALSESAHETATMTGEITASSEEMAASAGQIAHTASDLSQQSSSMAQTIQTLAGSAESLVEIAGKLNEGAHEGVERNAHLRQLALDNRARLDESTRSLAALTAGAEASASAIEQLASASEEVRSFVTLVQKLARQSKLLALNAAMEAARAGEHGHGFAVVAEEVRRLAAMSSDAAERTERVVAGVLDAVGRSRSSSEHTLETARAVRGATEQGASSFAEIEKAVADAESWTTSIERAVHASNDLARDMRGRLDSLATGTESFAAAMEEVAASSEEQSASTEQIAAAAATLAHAADKLKQIVANLRLDTGATRPPTPPLPAPAVRAPDVHIGVRRSGPTARV